MTVEMARKLRKRLTPQERKLWWHLRGLKEQGFHFRKQAPLEGFIVDFACLSARVVIEIDGSQHASENARAQDAARDAHLTWRGYTVLRFWNIDVDGNMDGVMLRVAGALGLAQEVVAPGVEADPRRFPPPLLPDPP